MTIKIFEKNEIHPHALALLRKHATLVDEDSSTSPIDGILIRTYTHVDYAFLQKYPKLRYIIRIGVGLDAIDIEECKKRGITIINSPGSNANAVSELVVLQTLLLKRKLFSQVRSLKENAWRDRMKMGTEIKGTTLGLVGCGAIGQLVARKFQGFEVSRVLGYDPYLPPENFNKLRILKSSLVEIYKKADIISLHIPLTPETKNIIGMSAFKKMKPNAIVINTSRGGIVNEKDLVVALKNNVIAGAALDVFEHEPDINLELLKLDNLVATPHIGALTEEAEEAMAVQAVENFLSVAV